MHNRFRAARPRDSAPTRQPPFAPPPRAIPRNDSGPADTYHPRGRPLRDLSLPPYLALSACIRVATDSTSATLSASTAGFSLAA